MTTSVTGFASWSQNLSVMDSRNQCEQHQHHFTHNLRMTFRHEHGTRWHQCEQRVILVEFGILIARPAHSLEWKMSKSHCPDTTCEQETAGETVDATSDSSERRGYGGSRCSSYVTTGGTPGIFFGRGGDNSERIFTL